MHSLLEERWGIGFNSHCLLGSAFKSSKTSASEAGWRIRRDDWDGGREGGIGGEGSQRWRIVRLEETVV